MSYGTYPVQTWSFTITYKKAEQPPQSDNKTSVSVNKQWSDSDKSHNPVTVHLLENGVDTGKTLTLNSGNGWNGRFDDLAINDSNGKPITYTVSEDKVKIGRAHV